MKLTQSVLLVVLILQWSCTKRKYPADQVVLEKENIFVSATLDGLPLDLRAGANQYYCYTSYRQGPDSIYYFKGELRKFDCSPCPRSLQLELSDVKRMIPGMPVQPDSSFSPGHRGFLPQIPNPHRLLFIASSNKPGSAFSWHLSSGETFSTDSVIEHTFTLAGATTLSLGVRTQGNCESMVQAKIFAHEDGSFLACGIQASPMQGTQVAFSCAVFGGKAPFRYQWSFGDNAQSSAVNPDHKYKYAGSYEVKLLVEDADHHYSECSFIYVAGNDLSSCAVNFRLIDMGTRRESPGGVKLSWTDDNGVAFRSDLTAQGPDNYFEVLDSRPFGPNEKGEKGRLLTLRFDVLLSDGLRKLRLKSDEAVMAVAYN